MVGRFFCVFLVVGFFFFCYVWGGRFITIWQLICSMMARSLVFSKACPTLGARIVLSV